MRYVYPALFDEAEGTVIVRFRDLPEAVTEGATRSDAALEAVECLDAALLFRLKEGAEVPAPSAAAAGEHVIAASPSVAAKVAFAIAFRASGRTRVDLAEELGLAEGEVRRMLDADHATKIDRLAEGLRRLGVRLSVEAEPAEAAA